LCVYLSVFGLGSNGAALIRAARLEASELARSGILPVSW
jgi:hypothetical protein